MTALALALVACCAMVCGTRLVLRGYDIREVEAKAAMRDSETLRRELESLRVTTDGLTAAFDRNEQQIAALRADMAVRSIA
jgi:uncharacterized OsmC-like protein